MNFFCSQGPHDSSQRPQNRRRPLEPPHYTVFGFAPVDDDSNGYLEHWFMHVYVDKHDVVTGVRFEESTTNRRRLIVGEMRPLCVSCDYFCSEFY